MPRIKNQVAIRREDSPKVQVKGAARIRQPQDFTMAQHDFSVHEYRVIIRIMEALQPKTTKMLNLGDFGPFIQVDIPTQKLVLPGSKNYTYMRSALETLVGKPVIVKGENASGKFETYAGLISEATSFENKRLVRFTISKSVLPLYLEMQGGYTLFAPDVTFRLSSINAMRIHQFCSHWRNKSGKVVPLERLKEHLGINDTRSMSQFKRDILNPVCEELKKVSDTYFTYERYPEKGKATGFKFFFHERGEDVLQSEAVKKLLKDHFDFNLANLTEVAYLFNDATKVHSLKYFLHKLFTQIEEAKGQTNEVKHKAVYALASIHKHFLAGTEGAIESTQHTLFE